MADSNLKSEGPLIQTLRLKGGPGRPSLEKDISEFTQQDGRKKRTAERSCVTNVTRLFLTCFVVIFT